MMEDTELEVEGEFGLEDSPDISIPTMTSSQFHGWTLNQEQEEGAEEEGENDQIASESMLESQQVLSNLFYSSKSKAVPEQVQQNEYFVQDVQTKGENNVPTLIFGDKWSKPYKSPSMDDALSNETLIGKEYGAPQYAQLVKGLESVSRKKEGLSSDNPLPVYYMELKKLTGKDRFDAFSEDEEPVLRTEYTPYVLREPDCPKPVVREENIIVYDVRKGPLTSKSEKEGVLTTISHTTSRPSLARRSTRIIIGSTFLEWKNQDLTPHQRDLFNVSFEELSPAEVSIIKGLWKCITSNLWTFGALNTINFFRIRGHMAFTDQKATPEEMMHCHFLWPHANQAMKSMESIVMNLHKPEECHKLVYEVGKKHGTMKTPLNEVQSELVINSFLYTFNQHVHPKLTLKELNILRKFSRITMFQFMDASRWDSEPLPLY